MLKIGALATGAGFLGGLTAAYTLPEYADKSLLDMIGTGTLTGFLAGTAITNSVSWGEYLGTKYIPHRQGKNLGAMLAGAITVIALKAVHEKSVIPTIGDPTVLITDSILGMVLGLAVRCAKYRL